MTLPSPDLTAGSVRADGHAVQKLLRSEDAGDLLKMALSSAGVSLQGWELEHVHARLGAETSATYLVRVPQATLRLVVSSCDLSPAERTALHAVRLESAASVLNVWAHPQDPRLPGLRLVEDRRTLEHLLSGIQGTSVHVAEPELLVLRPLRRAVHRVMVRPQGAWQARPFFIKTVQPARSQLLVARHAACALAPSAVDAGSGVVVLEEAQGLPLVQHLYQLSAHRLSAHRQPVRPDPESVFGSLRSISETALQLPRRPTPAERIEEVAESAVVRGVERTRLQSLVRTLRHSLLNRPGPVVPVHGDFHAGNIVMSRDAAEVTSLIDLDTLGPGFLADDAATFLGHLLTLPLDGSRDYAETARVAAPFWDYLVRQLDADDLAARTATVVLALGSGALSVRQVERHVLVAEQLVTDPNRVFRNR